MNQDCVFITGASRGIGKATALEFSKNNASLILLSRDLKKLSEVKSECLNLGAKNVEIYSIDLRNDVEIKNFFENKIEQLKKVTILINNAGLALGLSPFQESTHAEHKEMIEVNLNAPIQLTHLMLPIFLEKKEGHIVQLGSVAGRVTYPKGHVYCAVKAALKTFSESLRLDLLGTGIRVSEISPGMVESEFSMTRFKGDIEKAKKVYEGMNPLTPEDIAESILWICQRPRHINVQELVIYPTDQASPTQVFRKPT